MSQSCDPSVLMQAAACFDKCEPPGIRKSIKTYLLCQGAASGTFGKPSGPAVPTGFAFTIGANGAPVTASWNATPAGITKTEVWTSTDGVTFALETTVNAPGTSTTSFTYPAAGGTKYAKIRATDGTSFSAFTGVLSVLYTFGMEWATRVVTNGGARPAASTVTPLDTFRASLVADVSGVWAQMIMINIIAPDNDIALRTPFLAEGGNSLFNTLHAGGGGGTPYTLDVNGVLTNVGAGDGVFINSSFNCSTYFGVADGGLSVYLDCTVSNNNGPGGSDGAGYQPVLQMIPAQASANQVSAYMWSNATVLTQANRLNLKAFFSLNRTANNVLRFYYANSANAWNLYGSSAVVEAQTPVVNGLAIGALNNSAGGYVVVPQKTSFYAAHHGLTSAQGQALFNAAQALRVSLGGGFA